MAILELTDLPAAVQGDEMVVAMLDGANAKAARVAPCLVEPTTTTWAATTAYAIGDQVKIATSQYLQVTVAGTSAGSAPTVPALVDGTVTDGTVTWKRITPTPEQLSEARLVLIGAIKRWVEAGSGAISQQTVGPFSQMVDTRQRATGYNLWPSEIKQLQDICQTSQTSSGAFSFAPSRASTTHQPWCSLAFGATYCSCGADIAGYPLYEYVDD